MTANKMSIDCNYDYEKINDDRVFLFYQGRRVKVLKGREAILFLIVKSRGVGVYDMTTEEVLSKI